MKKKYLAVAILGIFIVGIMGLTAFAEVKKITITAWTIGPDNPSYNRKENLIKAGKRLNEILKAAGCNIRVEVKATFDTTNWESYKKRALMAFKTGKELDIIASGHEDLGTWASAGYVVPIGNHVKEFWNIGLYDIYKPLWNACKYRDKIYAIPQDTEARPLYVRKDKLKEMGWTDEQIRDLVKKFNKGEYTVYDMVKIAQKAQKAGVVKYGLIHRPKIGVDYFQIWNAFNDPIYDPKTGKLVFNKEKTLKVFKFIYDLTNTYKVTPKSMIGTPWNSVHKIVAKDGEALFYMGGTWNAAEWENKFHYKYKDIKKMFAESLFPPAEKGGKPNTISHPIVYMVPKQSKHPRLAVLLITLASAADLNAIHAVTSGHLAIRHEETAVPMYKKNKFLASVTYMLNHTRFIPNNPRFNEYNRVIFQAMTGLEAGKFKPEFAVNYVAKRLKTLLKNDVEIR
ncbi:MAG: extracellular solute-binding protein [Synergistetes bacterium]|nr:extracellular solute-binding protein [Synergistota bacterium]